VIATLIRSNAGETDDNEGQETKRVECMAWEETSLRMSQTTHDRQHTGDRCSCVHDRVDETAEER
jgi:hypothetical protein